MIDASVAVAACGDSAGFGDLSDPDLQAPSLMWSECRTILHLFAWRGELARGDAEAMHERLIESPVTRSDPHELGAEAWRIADELGHARTYDSEYVALASLLECRLVTLDLRLRRGADRLGLVVTPEEL